MGKYPMERMIYSLAVSEDELERIWDHCQNQGRDIPMYKQRLGSYITWVVELEPGAAHTRFLLEFSHLVTRVNAQRLELYSQS